MWGGLVPKRVAKRTAKRKTPLPCGSGVLNLFRHHKEKTVVLDRTGSDLLSQALRLSTIGAEVFNGRVRDGIGF